jgi:hypothetical protein
METTNNKKVLAGFFIKKNKILTFLEKIKNKCKTDINKVFVYEIDGNNQEYLVTFKTRRDKMVDFEEKATTLHVKNGCLFSINALNTIIDNEKIKTNTPNSEVTIDWEKYRGLLILLSKKALSVKKITKIDDKSLFLTE